MEVLKRLDLGHLFAQEMPMEEEEKEMTDSPVEEDEDADMTE